ncbi:MAG: hypothetical protein KDI56_16065 [Xanthomonadales bacterium]|nr:hypothetical protein [Xanthomonadales bacterium]
MSQLTVSPLLRLAIGLDGCVSALAGLASLIGLGSLAAGLGAPLAATLGVGLFMLLYGLGLTMISRAATVPSTLVWTLVLGNLGWVAASVALALSSWIQPQPWALALLLGQAGGVAVFSLLQYLGLRQAQAGPTQVALA